MVARWRATRPSTDIATTATATERWRGAMTIALTLRRLGLYLPIRIICKIVMVLSDDDTSEKATWW